MLQELERMLLFCYSFICVATVAVSRIVVAQNTNPDRVVASAFQMGPPLSVECLIFLFVKQNLARDKTVDHSGTAGLVKGNSTHTKTQHIPTMDMMIHSTLST
jgi:hypothetical protein